ncbi:hypothetical protein OAK17_00420 [Alphaproteobacteria bacterium]|nr:hypothetical protein [Alphaproteobacteria bacterium]
MFNASILKSKKLQEWGSSVGVTRYLYKVAIFDEKIKGIATILNDENCAGHNDWKLISSRQTDFNNQDQVINNIKGKVEVLDNDYYPKLKGEKGILKINPSKVENSLLLKSALENENMQLKKIKIGQKEIANYILDHLLVK